MEKKNYFEELFKVNVNDKVKKKGGFNYLSWAYAWAEIKKADPEASFKIYENADGLNYHHDGRTAWAKVSVTVGGLELIEYLPIMDIRNKSMALNTITSMEVTKTIQRALTKAAARHGLGLYVYAGEDLPEDENGTATSEAPTKPAVKKPTATQLNQAKKLGINLEGVCKYYEVSSVEELSSEQLGQAIALKEQQLAKNNGGK
jgi:hypothetical protein